MFVLVGVSTAAQCNLISVSPALPDDFLKILQCHVGCAGVEPILVALHTSFQAQAGLTVFTVSHNTNVQKYDHEFINKKARST